MKRILLLLLLIVVVGCKTIDVEDQRNPNDPIVIKVDECLDHAHQGVAVCLNSVTDDSRCPTNIVCVWEGDAVANFSIKIKDEINSFQLHTNTSFQNDTILQGYRIELVAITPYPSSNNPIDPKDYSAEILVNKE